MKFDPTVNHGKDSLNFKFQVSRDIFGMQDGMPYEKIAIDLTTPKGERYVRGDTGDALKKVSDGAGQ